MELNSPSKKNNQNKVNRKNIVESYDANFDNSKGFEMDDIG